MTYLNPAGRHERYTQKATYWSQRKQDGYGGEDWDAPVLILCRWEDFMEEQLAFGNRAEGETQSSNAHVFTMVPLQEGGYLYKGETTEANPSRLRVGHHRAFVIRKVAYTPSVKGEYAENTAFL